NLDGACIQSVNIIVDEDPMKQITVNNIGEVYVSNLYRITPPYSDAVFQILELSSMFLQVKTEDGLRLQYNWKELRLYLQVDESWKEDTVGLCGTFNGNIQDDFLSPAGMIESTPQLFGNSWKLSSACVPGHSIPQLDPCDIHQQAASYASEMCEILNAELFALCHEYLNPAPFYQQCKSDTCKCGETCLCAALAHYARQCRKHGVIIDFRAHVSECAVQCQETMEYGTCISSCNSNCRSLSLSEACGEECVEGCVCPGGTYYNSKSQKCVQKICKDGQMMYQGPSLAYGDRHYRTFDGLLFDYIGACKVYLVKSNIDLTMSITAENVDCYESGVICRKSLLINIGRSFIVFDNDSGKPNPSSLIDKRQPVFIWQAGYYTIVHIPTEDVTVLWDRKTTIHIQVGPRWQENIAKVNIADITFFKGKLTGLCGNFDLKTVNEMRSPENIESATPQEFGNSWTAAECVNSPDIRSPCSMNPLREPFAKRECGILLSEVFEACHPVVDVTWFYMNCLTDTCGCNRGGDCECFCTSVSAYAHRCCQQGITVDWRSPTVCPYDCEFYNKVLGKGPFKLVTYLESETVLAANFSGGAAFPVQGAISIPGVAMLFMLTPGLCRSKPHVTGLPAYTTTSKGPTKQPGTSGVTETSSATVASTTVYIDTSTKVADKTVSPLTTKPLTSESTVYSSPVKTAKTSAYTTTETKSPITTEAITSKSTVYSPPVETGKTTLTTVETTPQLPTELTTSKSPGYSPPVETGKTTLTSAETTPQLPTELTTSIIPVYSPPVETGKTTLTSAETAPQLPTELTTSIIPVYSPPVETGKTTLTSAETTPQLPTELTTSKSPGYSPPVETGKTTYATMKTKPPLFTESTTSKSTAYVSPLETVKTTAQEIKTPLTTKPVTSESTIYVSPFETEETTASTTQLTVSESSAASTVSAGPTVSLGTTPYPSAYTQTIVGLMTEKTISSFPTKLTTTTKTTAYPIERVKTTSASAVPLAFTETGRTTPEVPPMTIASTETSSSTHQVGVETTKTTTSESTKETTAETVASTSAELTKTTLTTLYTVDKVDTNITTLGTTTLYPFLTELSKTTLAPTKSETTVSVTPYSMASEKVWTTITPITSSDVSKSVTTYPGSTEHTAETTTTGYIFSTKPVTHQSTTPPLTSEEFVSTVATVSSLPQLTTSKTTSLYQTLPDGTSLTTGYPTEKTSTAEHSAKPATPYPDTAAETVQSSSTTSHTSSITLVESSTTSLQTVTSQTTFASEPTTTATTRSVFSTIKSTAGTTPGKESKHTPFSSGTTKAEAPVLLSTTAQLLGLTLPTSKVSTSSETLPVQTPETSTLSSLTTSQLKTEVTNATAVTGKEGVSTVPPKQEVSTTLLSASSESQAATPAVTLRTTGTSQVTPETVGTVTTTSLTPKPTLGTTLHTTTLSTSSTETPKEKWTTTGKTPTEEVTVSTTIVPLSTATTLLIYSPVTSSAVTTAATTASIRTEKQTTQAVTPSKPVTTASVTAVLNATVLTTTGKETTTSIITAAQTSTTSTYKTTPLPETSTGQTTKQPASTLESTAATTQVTPNATTAAESLRTTSSEYRITTSKEAVSNITVSVLSTVSPTSPPPATTAETESSSVSGPSVSTSTSYTNAMEYWSTQTTPPLLSSNETLTPLSPQSTSAHTTTTLVTSPKMCTPQYSEIIDECTKYVCMNGQLMLFNKSQNCPYNATPPNCGLLGFAILVNGDKCCPQWDCPCRCSVFPDLNIITFDGNSVAIYKAASYIVTQLPNETVSIQVQECQSSDTLLWNFTNLCLVALNITHKAHQVLIDRLQRRKNGFEILDTGNMYLIKTPAGLKIQWFHSTGMMVIETDSPSHKLTTMGLCGCCDGDPTNDLTLFNGTTVSESDDPTVFIDSWQVPNTTSFMGQNRRREVNCSTSDCSECLSMLSNQTFSSCHAFVPPKMFCEVWVRDAEYVKSPCTALAAYVAACHKFSICIEWRSPDYCSFMCPPELRYQACLPACNAKTCPNHESDSDLEECSGLTEGCVCPEGTLLHRPYSALCIPSEKCACTDSFGTPHASGEVWKASKDGCCMYKCDNDSIIPVELNCTKVPEPVCSKAGEVTVSLADDKSCCPQKACVCNQTLCDQYAPECKYGEKLVSYYREYSCCPDYICECDPDRCESDIPTCRDDQTLIATRTEGSCCMAYICKCACDTIPKPQCKLGEMLQIDNEFLTDPENQCGCSKYKCVKELVCVDGERGVMRPGQTLVEHTAEGICYTTQCTSHTDPVTSFYKTQVSRTNCTAQCEPVSPLYIQLSSLIKQTLDNNFLLTCTGKEDGKSCQKVTVRMTIRKNDCRSNRPVNIVSCDGKCPSASIYNYNINTYARFCKCCREIGLQRRSVQLYCNGNSTWVYYSIQEPTDCSCQWS
ncbi:UNVERIFIED_CONTAM: hypothetical protein FKN15_043994, partial [Acipenser sinensis]